MNETKTYTLAELQALNSDALNAMAAELRGFETVSLPGRTKYHCFLVGNDGKPFCRKQHFRPTTDRNQSGELLTHATGYGVNFVCSINGRREVTADFRGDIQHDEFFLHIPGATAHAETVAFCAAMLAMAGRLK